MRDVAALAKVSIKTVSRVVNAEAGVSPSLVRRVMAAAERLDYRHNMTASSLRRSNGRSATIGVVLEDVANPFSSALHRSIEDVAVLRGVLVLAGSSDEDEEREQREQEPRTQQVRQITSKRADVSRCVTDEYRLQPEVGDDPDQRDVDDHGGETAVVVGAQVTPEQHDDDKDRQLGQGPRPHDQHAVAQRRGGEPLGHRADCS